MKKKLALAVGLILVASLIYPLQVSSMPAKAVLKTITLSEDITTLNPFIGDSITDWWVYLILYDRLAVFAPPDLHPEPWLAESWEVSSDGLTWTLHLVKNATWHDGKPFTSEDVKFTVTYVKEKGLSIWLDEVEDITEVQTPDQYTVIVKTSNPLSYFTTFILPRLPIIPKHIWETIENPKEYANEEPVGSGPFTFIEYKPGEYIRFGAYENYWKGKPHIDEILAKVEIPSDVAVMDLKKGAVDLVSIDTPYVKEVEGDPNLKVVVSKGIYYDHLVLNTKRYPLSVKEFRQALAYAIDKAELVERVLLGYGDIVDAPGGVPAFDFWYNKGVTKYPYNPDKAKEILDNLGFVDIDGDGYREAPNGTKIEIELCNLAGYPPYIRMGDVIVEQVAKIGIKLNNVPVEWAAQSKKANERDFDILVWGWTISPEPAQYLGQFRRENPYWSCGEMRNETFNEIFDAQKTELDPNKRREMIFTLQEILAQELPVIPIWAMNVIEAYRLDTFTGYIPAPMGIGGIYNKLTWLNIRPVTGPEVTPVEVFPTWAYALFAVLIIVIAALTVMLLRKRKTKS